MTDRISLNTFPPCEANVYLKVAEIILNEFGLELVEIQNNSTVRQAEKSDELILKFVKD